MSERYTKLFSLPENLYVEGSPVILAAGALLKDTQTGRILAQLKLQNIATVRIKAATVRIRPLDTVGAPLGDALEHQYLDLDAMRDGYFGAKNAIPLPETARAFSVGVETVVFADNVVWTSHAEAWEALQSPRSLPSLYSSDVVEQFEIENGKISQNEFLQQKDLWTCLCGAVNHTRETRCHRCANTLQALREIDVAQLKAGAAARLEKQRQEAAEEMERARKEAKKNRKAALIAAGALALIVALIVLLNTVIIPNSKYNEALALMDAGQYEEAIAAFGAINGYKDSKARSMELWGKIAERETISAGNVHTVGLKADGTVVAVGDNEDGQCNIPGWTDIVAISAGQYHTLGLEADGTVVSVGSNEYGQRYHYRWSDIKLP